LVCGKKNKVTGGWKKMHGHEVHDLSSSPNINRVIKTRMMRWAGHVAYLRERTGACRVFMGNLREIYHLEDLGLDRTTLEWIVKKSIGRAWNGLIWLMIQKRSRLLTTK
jgi:hypothetical protein